MKMYVLMILDHGGPGESAYLISERPDLPAGEMGYVIPFRRGEPRQSLVKALRTSPMSFSARGAKQVPPVEVGSLAEIPRKCQHLF